MSRGKLPRSFKINSGDPLYGSDTQTDAYLYDSALAIIATAGTHKNDLAFEILMGVISSQTASGKFPFVANHLDASTTSSDFPNQTMALMAYAIGFYMEMNPSSAGLDTIEQTLRNILQFLQLQRGWLYNDGLIYSGETSITYDYSIKTETNLLAYFAFKQAGKVLTSIYYSDAADELKNAIINRLWANDKLNFGLSNVGVVNSTNKLEVNAYGAIFFSEIGDHTKALACLSKCEVFVTIDENSGAVGYTEFTGSPDNVWFEMSYAVALGYYRVNNMVKYNQIVNELNRYVEVDGGFKGTMIKTYTSEGLIGYEAIGSTAWAVIANLLKGSAFKIRTSTSPATGNPTPFYNAAQSTSFSKTGCAVDYHPTSHTWVIPEGRYISYIDQTTADSFADDEMSEFGQDYINIWGTCIPDTWVGNEFQTADFDKNDCAVGYYGSTVAYSVPADTYFALTVGAANILANNDITANGQAYANAHGICIDNHTYVTCWVLISDDGAGHLTAQAFSTTPVNTDIAISYEVVDWTTMTSYTGYADITIYSGDYSSSIGSIAYPGAGSYYGQITAITPSTSGTYVYLFV